MKVEIRDEHRWLESFTGDWQMIPDPDGPPEHQTDKWFEHGRVLAGGAWLKIESRGEMPDGSVAETVFTVGFDPKKGKYVGTWIGSMMTNLWTYEGVRNGDALVLESIGPSFDRPGETQTYRDIYALDGPDGRSLTSETLQDDGSWKVFMTVKYRRN